MRTTSGPASVRDEAAIAVGETVALTVVRISCRCSS